MGSFAPPLKESDLINAALHTPVLNQERRAD